MMKFVNLQRLGRALLVISLTIVIGATTVFAWSQSDNFTAESNVGIGTESPTEKLDVSGAVKAVKFTGDESGLTGIIGDNQWNSIASGINYANGNVGIGTENPTEKLEVAGTIKADNFVKTDGTPIGNSNNSYASILEKDGNVGISTTTPTEKLDVAGTVKAMKFIGDGSGLTGITGGGSQWSNITGGISYASGNVGIRTTDPKDTLDVRGGVIASKYFTIRDYDDGTIDNPTRMISRDGNFQFWSGGVLIGGYSNNSVKDIGDGNLVVRGKVGIGTTAPIRNLHLQSPSVSSEIVMEVANYKNDKKKWNIVVDGEAANTAGQPSKMYFKQLNDAGSGGTVPLLLYSNGDVKVKKNIVSDGDICIGKCS